MAPGPDDQSQPKDSVVNEPMPQVPVATAPPGSGEPVTVETESKEPMDSSLPNAVSPDVVVEGTSSGSSGSQINVGFEGNNPSTDGSSQYGPMRRIPSKNGPAALYRPPAMREHDFAEMMKDVVPRLLEHAMNPADTPVASQKRPVDVRECFTEPPSSRPRTEALEVSERGFRCRSCRRVVCAVV